MPDIRFLGLASDVVTVVLSNGTTKSRAISDYAAGRTDAEIEALADAWAAANLPGVTRVHINSRTPWNLAIYMGAVEPPANWWVQTNG